MYIKKPNDINTSCQPMEKNVYMVGWKSKSMIQIIYYQIKQYNGNISETWLVRTIN